MSCRVRVLTRLTLGVALLVVSAVTFAQSYGLGDQILSLGYAAFRAQGPDVAFGMHDDGYLYGTSSAGAYYVASVQLPQGAFVVQMCVYANVADASQSVTAYLNSSRLLAGGQGGDPQWGNIASVTDDIPIGYGTVCTNVNYAFHDVDGNYNVAYDILVTAGGTSGLGGVRLAWHRQMSLPPVSPTFGDVQPGDFGYQQIEALFASGVTGGCGGGNYCPNDTVTRAQMAIFLARALGLYWSN
jgi:hypothetical protein